MIIVELCVHREAKPHRVTVFEGAEWWYEDCPGGRVLEQAIIWWCDNHDDFMRENDDLCSKASWSNKCLKVERVLLDALASAQETK